MSIAAVRSGHPVIHRAAAAFALACAAFFCACEDDQAPVPAPAGIEILSGDSQYTRKGTELEEPVVVRVTDEEGGTPSGVEVRFQVIEGGGSVSRSSASTKSDGQTSVRWTMGPDTGTNRLRVYVAENSSIDVVAAATSSEYYCPEEDPTFVRKFLNAGNLMLFTRASSRTQIAGTPAAGLVRLAFPPMSGTSVHNYDEGTFINVVRDCVFSANGDLFISWNNIRDEVAKIATDGTATHFATLESSLGAEIAMTPGGVLVGCDERGPFAVTCRDTIFRYEDAVFSGVDRDAANNDAVAVDPNTHDLYFLYKADRTLRRVPLDGIAQTDPSEPVATLPLDVTDGARGMVVDGTDGSIYILVESTDTKSIVKVTSAGAPTTLIDFILFWEPNEPGVQSDLAISRQARLLFTLDTTHNAILVYDLAFNDFAVIYPPGGDPYVASDDGSGERVGLDVLP
jgi:hypothetical protein